MTAISRPGLCSGSSSQVVRSSSCNTTKMGWGLKMQRKCTRLSPKARQWLKKKFDAGQESGMKADPAQVAREMQFVRNVGGNLVFSPEEWLTPKQIANFFSRHARKVKSSTDQPTDHDDNDEEDIANEYENAIEVATQQLRLDINDLVALRHPVMHSELNLCQLSSENKLPMLKMCQLKDICESFGLPLQGPKNKKTTFLSALGTLVSECECTAH